MSVRLSSQYFLSFAFVGIFAPYFALYLHALAIGVREIAILLAIMQAMRMLGPLVWSLAGERLTPLCGLQLALLGSLLGLGIFMCLDGTTGRLLAMVVLALFWSATLPLLETQTLVYLGGQLSPYGSIRRWGSLGFVVAVLVMGQVLETWPATVVPWACGLVLVGMLLLVGGMPETGRRQRTAAAVALASGALLKQPPLLAIFAAGFLMAAAHGPLNVFYSIHLAGHGYGGTLIGMLWALGALAELALLPLLSHLDRRHSPQLPLVACFAAAAIRFVAIGWGSASLAVLVCAQVLHALSFGMHHVLTISAIDRRRGEGNQARSLVLYASCQGAGTLAGSLASGLSWNTFGGAWTFTFGASLALVGMLLILAFAGDE
jgi:MFS transporter, PPP family, 3-phenylpropionic acid transporter